MIFRDSLKALASKLRGDCELQMAIAGKSSSTMCHQLQGIHEGSASHCILEHWWAGKCFSGVNAVTSFGEQAAQVMELVCTEGSRLKL